MNDKPSARIIAFPCAPEPADASADRLPRALAALEVALSLQREALARWQATFGELRGSMATVSGSADRCQDSLAQLGTLVVGLDHANRALTITLDDAL
ncbi:MAG TPA: hypothetical protein VGH36_07475 [Acetobacteraceae bacterium]|jgi:hypothetical protein